MDVSASDQFLRLSAGWWLRLMMMAFPRLPFIQLHLSSAAIRFVSLFGGPVRVSGRWWCNACVDALGHAILACLMRLRVMMMVLIVLLAVVICLHHGVEYWKGIRMLWVVGSVWRFMGC